MINCKGCARLSVNNFTCRYYCLDSGSECHAIRTSDIGSPITPDSNECPGFTSDWGR